MGAVNDAAPRPAAVPRNHHAARIALSIVAAALALAAVRHMCSGTIETAVGNTLRQRGTGDAIAHAPRAQAAPPQDNRLPSTPPAPALATSRYTHVVGRQVVRAPGTFKFKERCPEWSYRRGGDGEWAYWPSSFDEAAQIAGVDGRVAAAAGNVSGVIVTLARRKNLYNFRLALTMLDENVNSRWHYPVVVMHDDLKADERAELQAGTQSVLSFHEIQMCVPEFLRNGDVPEYVEQSPINYRSMMRLFSHMVFMHPALAPYTHFMRMDTDSFFLSPLEFDVFQRMRDRGWMYGFVMLWIDSWKFVAGLAEQLTAFMDDTGIAPGNLFDKFVLDSNILFYDGMQVWNNFEVMDLSFVRSSEYDALARRVDESGIMYLNRVGDAPIRSVAIAVLLSSHQVHRFDDIGYQHQDQFTCPADNDFLLDEDKQVQLPGVHKTHCPVVDDMAVISHKCHKQVPSPTDENTTVCAMQRRDPCPASLKRWDACKHFSRADHDTVEGHK